MVPRELSSGPNASNGSRAWWCGSAAGEQEEEQERSRVKISHLVPGPEWWSFQVMAAFQDRQCWALENKGTWQCDTPAFRFGFCCVPWLWVFFVF